MGSCHCSLSLLLMLIFQCAQTIIVNFTKGIDYACRVDKDSYADKNQHNHRADKNPYRHGHRADSQRRHLYAFFVKS